MRRQPVPSRRAVLGGLVGTGTALLAGCSTAYDVLPDRAVHARTRRRGLPDVSPAVETTDDHLRTCADEIDGYVDAGLEAWDRMDDPERRVIYSRQKLERAGEFTDGLPSEPPIVDTVESAGYYLSQAAGSYAYAKARLEEFDGHPTDGVDGWLDEVDAARERFAYETDDPEVFLAYGRSVEYSLHQAELGLSRQVDADIDERGRETSRAERIADIYGDVRRSRLRLLDAAAYREALRERDPGGERFAETLAAGRTVLRERIEDRRAERDEWRGRLEELDGERRDVHEALYARSEGWETEVSSVDRYVDRGYEVYGTVELATAWLVLTAARDERERIENASEDTLEATDLDAAKRDAVERLESRLEDDPGPLARLFLSEARSLLYVGDSALERDRDESEEDRRWTLANGYARYLLARGMLERAPDAVSVLIDGE